MIGPPGSLERRLAIRFAAFTTALVVILSAVTTWFVARSAERERLALIREEIDEMCALLPARGSDEEAFRDIAAELAERHPENPLAWRVLAPDGSRWEYGERGLLARMPAEVGTAKGQVLDLGEHLSFIEASAGDGWLVGLLLDGRAQSSLLRRYGVFSVGLGALALALALIGGAYLGRVVGGELRRVAESVRSVRAPDQDVVIDLSSAPSELREVADALTEMLANIRREAERVRLLTAGLAHELRSPVQNLLGETEVALLREREPEEYRRVLESQIQELRDLGRVVDNLVTLCAEREARSEDLESFDLGREAELRLFKTREVAARRDIEVEFVRRGDLELRGDREALLLALRNLVANAIHWSPEGTSIEVTLTGRAGEIEVTVDDAGPGVPEALRSRIFEPFFRTSGGGGRRVGYGLGLALTRSAIVAHGGTIEVGTSPLGGARFRVRLPREGGDHHVDAA